MYFGLNGDRDAMPDVDVLAALIEESLAELVGQRGARRRPAAASTPRAARRQRRSDAVDRWSDR